MINRLRTVRLSRLQLGVVVLCSSSATAGVISIAGHRSHAAEEAIALLHHRSMYVASAPQDTTPSDTPLSGISGSSLLDAGTAPKPAKTETATSSAPVTPAPATTTPATTTTTSTTPSTPATTAKHVFVISLTAPNYEAAFGKKSVATYLNRTLRPDGTLLSGYQSLTGSELPDELAMVSGQPANADTQGNCASYASFPSSAGPDKTGAVTGKGCVYPNSVTTVADQVGATGTWGAYIEGMSTKTTCVHPNADAADNAVLPFAGDEYATRHNPFIYFNSLLDSIGCSTYDQDLTKLPKALKSAKATPQYVYIAPSLCDDASSTSCPGGAESGLAGEDAFLKTWVPQILDSAAYKDGGVLMIVFAPSKGSGTATPGTGTTTATSATGTTTAPATTGTTAVPTTTGTTTTAGTTTATGTTTAPATTAAPVEVPPAGTAKPVKLGALILSSSYGKAGGTVTGTFDPDSILRSTEQLLGQPYLAGAKTAQSFVSGALPKF